MSAALVARGLKGRTVVRAATLLIAALSALTAAACGSEPGKLRAVECKTDADCETEELGVCESVSCVKNRCEVATQPDGHRCDDDDPVTSEDACLDGICAGIIKECDDDLGPCLKAVYDPASDECVVEPVDDGVPCDDSDACTQLDTCQAGECVGDEPKICEAQDDCHGAGSCDPESGECSEVVEPDGTACDDGESCTTGDACEAGACVGEAVVCDDGLACSVDSCDQTSGSCASDTTGCSCTSNQECDDGNACNGEEVCDAGSHLCQLGPAVVCPASTDPCLQNVCDAGSGACELQPVMDGTACNDASACTGTDTCQDGLCVGSDPVVCTALSQCHLAGTCDKITGACSNPEKPASSSCDDGNACTPNDNCQSGACVGSGQVTCSPSDQCHDAGVCNPQTGGCTNPNKTNGVKCNDANPCTIGDACQNGACTPATQVVCAIQDSCHTAGTCNPQTGVCSNPAKPDGSTCNDGKTCTGPDTCSTGVCGGGALSCDDQVACTVDSCSEAFGGCVANSTGCACASSGDCDDGNPCNGAETCNLQTMQCQLGTALDCSSFGDACSVGTCNALTGQCEATPKANGSACDDGDKCTQASTCQGGVCAGTSPVVCTALDQCHDAGTCNPGTGICSDPPRMNGSACNDSNACTRTDTCQSGVCTGGNAVVCSALDQCHNPGVCDTSTGICSDPAKTNGSSCNDSSLCTQTDTCQGGICLGGSPVTCSPSDQCHQAGTCDPATGDCSDPAKKDDTPCVDADLCTLTDTCQSGECTGSNPVKCVALDQCHLAGTCAPATGVCSDPAKMNGTACNDGNLCSQTDTCQSGACSGGNPVVCVASDDCHNIGTCAPATGVCSNPAKPDNTPCNDGKACTSSDKCTTGRCAGSGITCSDMIACTVDTCVEPSGCNYDPSQCGCAKDADCDDGNACNGVETCNLGTLSCQKGTDVDCSNLDDACNTGACDPKTGACVAVPVRDGTGCDDGNACTATDACASGACVGSNAVVCKALDQCHNAGICDTGTGVCSDPAKPNGTTCNDGDACSQTDTCQSGSCTGSNPVTCTASDQCHNPGTCNPSTGACSNPAKTDGATCNDGSACSQTDTCQKGICTGSNPVVCTALDQCHNVGTCAPATGVCSNPAKNNGTTCDDDNLCTKTDTCQGGNCTGADPVSCSALGQCYLVGACDPDTGLCSNPFASDTATCNDSNACTSGETCDGMGVCKDGSTVVCQPPANFCKTNTCNVSLGCQLGNKPNGTPCDDSSACTQQDVCSAGNCSGGDPRDNRNGDWTDDPGARSVGPTSVDTFTDRKQDAVIVGTYHGGVRFEDKDNAVFTPLPLPTRFTTGIYWTRYDELGGIVSVANIGGATGQLSVEHAAGHSDDSFTLLGTLTGSAEFGRDKTTTFPVDAKSPVVWIAHYKPDGSIAWVALMVPGDQVPFTADSVAAFDDQSVIAIGAVAGPMSYQDATGKPIGATDRKGVWAVRLSESGVGQWAQLVVWPEGTANAAARMVTTHEDGGASLTGSFTGDDTGLENDAGLGPNGEIKVSVSAAEQKGGRDIWFQKLDKEGNIKWGGRVGSTGADVPGDVARLKGGGTLLLANTRGDMPNATDSKTSQQLYSTGALRYQSHVLVIDEGGVMQTDGLIADAEGNALGYQLDLDPNDFYSVAGIFGIKTSFWGKLGFGSGSPPGSPDLSIASLYQGPTTLFAARVDASAIFDWAVQAGGDNSGMTSPSEVPISPWDIVLTGHASHSLTLAGMFHTSATFGDKAPETLQSADATVGNPFVVHLNSEAEYDYCP
jgi:hypothetical protein